MERLIEECELECPDDKQIQIFDKCLALVRADRDVRSKSCGWLLLTKILERCSPACLRAVQSRVVKKLVDVKGDPNIYNGVFVRQLLIRNPQVGNLQAELVRDIIFRFIDIAVRSGDPTLEKLCYELYSIRYGCDSQMTERLLATLSAAISNRLLSHDEREVVLNLETMGISSLRNDLCRLLLGLYSSALARAKQGQYIPRDTVVGILDEALNDPQLRDAALVTIQSMCSNGRSAMLPLIPRTVLMLISKLDSPSSTLYDTLAHISRIYGSGSTLFRHLYEIFSGMKHPLDEQGYGLSAGRLLSAVIESSAFLVKPEVILSIQRKICEEIVRNPDSVVYRDILASLLSCSYELAPPPVQIARTVMARCANSSEMQTLRRLCEVITRPRIQNLAHHEVVSRCNARKRSDAIGDGWDKKELATAPNMKPADELVEFDRRVAEILQQGEQVKREDEKMSTSEPVPSAVSHNGAEPTNRHVADSPEIIELPQEVEVEEIRHNPFEPSPEPATKKAKFMKKKKAKRQQENVTLLKGESTVEEILSTFCPD